MVPIRFHIIHRGGGQALGSAAEGAGRHAEQRSTSHRRDPVQNHRCPGVRAARMVPPRIRYAGRGRDEDCARQGHRSLASTSTPAEPGGGLLGYATFPWWLAETPQLDGVVLHHASFPNSPTPWVQQPWPFDLGMTAVHEIGHWSGLYHTFQGGCEAPGDDVTDTPSRRAPRPAARSSNRPRAPARRASTPSRITWTIPTMPA